MEIHQVVKQITLNREICIKHDKFRRRAFINWSHGCPQVARKKIINPALKQKEVQSNPLLSKEDRFCLCTSSIW